MASGLNARQLKFAQLYAKGMSATRAYIEAGYKVKGNDSAKNAASRLLTNVYVTAEVKRLQAVGTKRAELSVERWVQELARMAMVDPRRVFNEDGTVKPVPQLDDDAAATISGIDVEERVGPDGQVRAVVKKIRFWDKNSAMTTAGKFLGTLVDKSKVEMTGKDGAPLVNLGRLSDEQLDTLERILDAAADAGTGAGGEGPAKPA